MNEMHATFCTQTLEKALIYLARAKEKTGLKEQRFFGKNFLLIKMIQSP